MTALVPLEQFTRWLATGERGLSSEAIVSHLTGVPVGRRQTGGWALDYPHDPADFRRCELLLATVPLARVAFPSMRSASPVWARLVDAWDEIHETMEAESPGYLSTARGAAPRAFALMRRVIADGVICDVCAGTGHGVPCDKCKGSGKQSGGRCSACRGHGAPWCRPCRGDGYTKRAKTVQP